MEPCGFPVEVCEECCAEALEELNPEQIDQFTGMAARFLWAATGKRFGLCEKTYRPCRRACGDYWGGLPHPTRISGEWVNVSCGSCRGQCGCDTVSEVIIPDTAEVVSVRIDGEDYDPFDTVAVYDRRRLVRVDGGAWPGCQNLSSTDGPGTWSVTVLEGTAPPAGTGFVVGLLTCEIIKACTGSDDCRLPRRLQTITRQGVTVGFQDQFDNLGEMRTGLWEVDAWIEAARTTGWSRPSVSSVDVPRASELTWPLPEHYPSI